MKDKLAKLPLEQLIELRDAVTELTIERISKELHPGMIVHFLNSNRERVYIRISRVNDKTVSGVTCDTDGDVIDRRIKWKVHKHLVMPYYKPKKPIPKPTGIGADKPAQPSAW